MNNKRLIAEIINGEEVIMTIDDNMLSCEFGALDRGNITDVVDWGIYANRGSISFIDNIGYFNNQNVNSSEIKNHTVKFYLMKNEKILIATFNIDSAEFTEETREVNIELVSKLLNLTKEKTTQIVYPFYPRKTSYLLELINEKITSCKISVGEDSENITKTMIDCPYIGIDTVWNIITKICQATMSRVVEDESGNTIITGSFPNRKNIIVNPKNIINISNKEFVRINNASIDVTNREVFKGEVLDGSSKNFSIKHDENNFFSGVEGFTIGNSRVDSTGGYYNEYVDGTLHFKTPYKIFKAEEEQSIVNEHLQMGTLTANSAITEDDRYSRNSVLCSNVSVVDETDISAKVNELRVTYKFTEPESYFHAVDTEGGIFKFSVYTFVDNGTTTISITTDGESETIQSNDLIQNDSTRIDYGDLGQYILDEVKKRYSNGIECFEIDCLFNDYYYDDGSLAFSSSDLSTHFKKYDVIIPYVMKNGTTVPLRKNQDGTPKKFRVIGISYSYDGLLRQKLYVQEERYDVD